MGWGTGKAHAARLPIRLLEFSQETVEQLGRQASYPGRSGPASTCGIFSAQDVSPTAIVERRPDTDSPAAIAVASDQGVGDPGLFCSPAIGENSRNTSGPCGVRKEIYPVFSGSSILLDSQGLFKVVMESLAELGQQRRMAVKFEWVARPRKFGVEEGWMKMQIRDRFAVAVIVQQFTDFLELLHVPFRQAKGLCQLAGRFVQIVAKCTAYRPGAVLSLNK